MKKIKLLGTIFLVSFFIQFAWEFLQSPFYTCFDKSLREDYLMYLQATIGDGIITVLLYLLITFFRKDFYRIRNLNIKDVFSIMLIGAMITAALEYQAVFISSRWQYSHLMPTIFGIGVLPLLQMMILPILSLKLSEVFIRCTDFSK